MKYLSPPQLRLDAPRIKVINKFKGRSFDKRFVIRGSGGRFQGSRRRLFSRRRGTKRGKRGTTTKAQPLPDFHKEIEAAAKKINRTDPKQLSELGKRFTDRHIREGTQTEFTDLINDLTHYHDFGVAKRNTAIASIVFDSKIGNQKQVKASIDKFLGITGGDGIPKTFTNSTKGIYTNTGTRNIFLKKTKKRAEIYREMGYLFEADNPELLEAAKKFRESRTTGDIQKLKDAFPKVHGNESDDIMFRMGNFIDDDIGIIYPNDKATMVYAKGLEFFTNNRDLQAFHKADPEHFNLIVGGLLSNSKKAVKPAPKATPKIEEVAENIAVPPRPKAPDEPTPTPTPKPASKPERPASTPSPTTEPKPTAVPLPEESNPKSTPPSKPVDTPGTSGTVPESVSSTEKTPTTKKTRKKRIAKRTRKVSPQNVAESVDPNTVPDTVTRPSLRNIEDVINNNDPPATKVRKIKEEVNEYESNLIKNMQLNTRIAIASGGISAAGLTVGAVKLGDSNRRKKKRK